MDTSRIVINIIDQSTSLIENPTAITGFTVVKAPKGPKTPIRVNSGAAAALKDIFGESTQKYPELFEVETFNREYDLWVSAPYEKATVPVAYITGNGIVVGANAIDYTDKLESVVLGETDPVLDDVEIDGLNSKIDSVKCLFDTRYPLSQKAFAKYDDVPNTGTTAGSTYKASDLDLSQYSYPDFKADALVINLGVPFKFFATEDDQAIEGEGDEASASVGYVPNIKDFKIVGFSSDYYSDFVIENGAKIASGTNAGKVEFKVKCNGEEVGYILASDDETEQLSNLEMVITGYVPAGNETAPEGVVTSTYIKTSFDTDAERSTLKTYFVGEVSGDDIHGAIIPKYPSDRVLHIDFSEFNDLKGYSAKSWSSRNILKMDVYEEGAFHDENHKIHVEGSLNQTDRDANGGKIGFTFENGTYAAQHLVYVFTKDPFTPEDLESINKNIKRYPSISLFGGTREFYKFVKTEDTEIISYKTYYTKEGSEYKKVENPITENLGSYYEQTDNIALHNYGWEKSEEGDYTDVDIFFNSELNNVSNWKSSKFFKLAKVDKVNHKLAGYYFNKTLSPEEVEVAAKIGASAQLSFGRNYWNIDNYGLISLDSGAKILSPLTGAMSVMECRILENRWGGLAPMWENTGSPSMGGQLNSIVDIYKLKYRYTKTQLDYLDDFNYNPVVNDRQYGFMVVGQKTCQPGEITDWSYIGHAAAFLNFIKEVRANVMIPQLGKANNPYYRTLRKEQVERYLAKRLEGTNRIWAYADVDTSTADGVNDVFARKAKKFIINVKVMVDTFSEKVELNFTNLDQEATVNFG